MMKEQRINGRKEFVLSSFPQSLAPSAIDPAPAVIATTCVRPVSAPASKVTSSSPVKDWSTVMAKSSVAPSAAVLLSLDEAPSVEVSRSSAWP